MAPVNEAFPHNVRNMYGEPLRQQFFEISPQDVAQADCVIIMGTSLSVKPFSERSFIVAYG
jgi:NAD-dependent SIR2 family protein deacetylase